MLQILQFVLQLSVLLLVLLSMHLHSWEVVEFMPSASDDNLVNQLTFSPSGYCFKLSNGSSDCQPFMHAILENSRQPVDGPRASADTLAVLPSHQVNDNANNQDYVVSQALSSWCQTRGELTWYMQGAQNVACLVVLETVNYTMILWGFFAILNLALSSTNFAACHAFTSFASALLGLLVTLAWWYYRSTYIDREYLDELGLLGHHGGSYHCALVAFALATANAQIAFDATGPIGTPKYTRRFIRPTRSTEELDDWDPLSCPANYLV
ncbi:hypothetical protein V7S43_014193 [Phytophthora oleae]|uniref:Uncharacterized protein n=1 Tax=Phytophthora oleae TaxID=2107226 RepID=A0ABD3F526_9STRA